MFCALANLVVPSHIPRSARSTMGSDKRTKQIPRVSALLDFAGIVAMVLHFHLGGLCSRMGRWACGRLATWEAESV